MNDYNRWLNREILGYDVGDIVWAHLSNIKITYLVLKIYKPNQSCISSNYCCDLYDTTNNNKHIGCRASFYKRVTEEDNRARQEKKRIKNNE
jgi:hypothetical protein